MFGGPRVGGSEVWRFGGSGVLSSRWFDIWTGECYREFGLFNRRLALMYDGRVETRTREWEYWNSLIYWKQKGENWDEDMKMDSEFKRTKTERWRQMKTEMWLGFSEVVQSSESDRKCVWRVRGYSEFRVLVSVVSEYQRMVGMESEERQGIDLGLDRILAIGWGSRGLNTGESAFMLDRLLILRFDWLYLY